ncbi:MAG: hypothetical protein AMXMBFR13_21100 [Phycisphaerae bacterium]
MPPSLAVASVDTWEETSKVAFVGMESSPACRGAGSLETRQAWDGGSILPEVQIYQVFVCIPGERDRVIDAAWECGAAVHSGFERVHASRGGGKGRGRGYPEES